MDIDKNISEKERQIIEAAIKIFSEKGFDAATSKDIAKSAGVSEGTIFRYFKTKKDIMHTIIMKAINLMSGRIALESIEKIFEKTEEKEFKEIFKEVVHDRMDLVQRLFPMLRIVIVEALYHEDTRNALYENVFVRGEAAFKMVHEKMVNRGFIRSDIPYDLVFRTIIANIVAYVLPRELFNVKSNEYDMDRELDYVFEMITHGIEPTGG